MSPLDSSCLCLLREAMSGSGFIEIATVPIEQGDAILLSDEEKLRLAKVNDTNKPWLWFFVKGKGSGRAKRLVDYGDTFKPPTELQYHLRTKWARNTGLFFHHKERGLLVQLDYDESDVMGRVDGYWKLRLYLEFRSIAEIRNTGASIQQVPFLTARNANLVNHFHLVSTDRENPLQMCYRYDQTKHGEILNPNALARSITSATDGVLQFLQPKPFTPTDTKDFPPHYVFPKCEELFWQKFDAAKKRNIIALSEESLRGSPRVSEKTPTLATQHA